MMAWPKKSNEAGRGGAALPGAMSWAPTATEQDSDTREAKMTARPCKSRRLPTVARENSIEDEQETGRGDAKYRLESPLAVRQGQYIDSFVFAVGPD